MDTDKEYSENGKAYTDAKKLIGIVLCIMLYILGSTGCSSSNRSHDDSKPELLNRPIEYKDGGSLVVTFTASNNRRRNYTYLNVGINDIIIHVKSGNKHFVQSLTNQTVHRAAKDNNLTELNLAKIDDNAHLYYGVFNVPSGTLEKIEVVFSGNKTGIATDTTEFTLIDSFFNYFTNGNILDDVHSRQVPIHVQTSAIEDIRIKKDSVAIIAIDIDIDLSITPDPIKNTNSNLAYARITPAITLREIEKSGTGATSFELVFKQFQYIDMAMGNLIDNAMAIGNQQEMLFIAGYDTDSAMQLSVNSNTVTRLNEIEGLHFFDMRGTMTIEPKGYHYSIKEASILTAQEDFGIARYEGVVTGIAGNQISLSGSRVSLKPNFNTNSQYTYFKGKVLANLPQLKIGDHVTLYANDNTRTTKLISLDKPKDIASESELLTIQSTIAFPSEDMFNISNAKKNDTSIQWEIGDQNCSDFITNNNRQITKSCNKNNRFNTIVFNRKQEGSYTIVETRKAMFDKSPANRTNTINLLIHKPDTVYHFTDADTFMTVIERLLLSGGRANGLVAKGTLTKKLFNVQSAGITVLHSQPVFDTDASNAIAHIITEKGITTENNINTYTKSIPFTTLSSIALIEATSSMPQHLLERNKKYMHTAIPLSQRSNNTTILFNTGIGVTEQKVPPTKTTMTNLPGVNITADIKRNRTDESNDQLMTTENGENVILIPQAESQEKTILGGLVDRQSIDNNVLFADGTQVVATTLNALLNSKTAPVILPLSSKVLLTINDAKMMFANQLGALLEETLDPETEKGYENEDAEQPILALPDRVSILGKKINDMQQARATAEVVVDLDDTPKPVISRNLQNQQLLINDFKEIMSVYFDINDELTNTVHLSDKMRSDLTNRTMAIQTKPTVNTRLTINPLKVKVIDQTLEKNRARGKAIRP